MDHSDEFMSTATSHEHGNETNLATQGGFDVPAIPVRNEGNRSGGILLT